MDKMALTFWMLLGMLWGYICHMQNWLHAQDFVRNLDMWGAANLGMKVTMFLPGSVLWIGIGAGVGFLMTLFASAGAQKF